MARTALRRPLAAALAALAATPALSGSAPPIEWLAPTSGSFYDPTRWSGGVGPQSGSPAIINATGAAYTVGWPATVVGLPRVSSVLLDSPDATILYRSINPYSGDAVTGDFVIRRGALDFQGRLAGPGMLHIESGATFDIRADTEFSTYPGAVLSLAVSNEGLTTIRGDGLLTQGPGGGGSIPGNIRIVNEQSGVMRFEGGNFFFAGTLNNYGLIEIVNDPRFGGPDSPLEIDGTAFGIIEFADSTPAAFNNHGAVQIQRGNLRIEGNGLHSGSFEMLSSDSVLSFRGDHAFLPGTTISGAGLTRFNHSGTITGAISIEGDATIDRVFNTAKTIDASLDVGGTLTLDFDSPSFRFGSSLRAGLITGDLDRDFVFAGPSEIAFSGAVRSAEFLAPTIIRGNMASTSATTLFHGSADIFGSVSNAIFMGGAIIEGSADRVEFQRGGSVGGDLTGYAHAVGAMTVGGDLLTTTGSWSFEDGPGSSLPARLDVAGNVNITRNFTIQGVLNAGGDFSATHGNFETITADTIRFGIPVSSVSLDIGIRSGSQIVARDGRAIIQRARIVANLGNSSPGSEIVTFASGFEIIYNPITPFTRAGFRVNLDADALSATSFRFFADSVLAGTLDVAIYGDSSLLSYGNSFTILTGAVMPRSTDPLPTITGEFQRFFLPSLANGLFFDVVYEPSAVRLVVVPAPGAITAFAGLGALTLARRRRRNTVALVATLAAITGANALAGPTTAHWAAPVSGEFYDPANWDDGIGPAVGADMIVDAAGQPYTVDWLTASGRPRVNSFLLDSHDARVVMRGGDRFNDRDFRVAGDTVIRRGVLDLNGQIFGTGALRIESGGTLDIQNGPSNDGFRGAQLALDVFNDGNFIVRGGATLTQIRTPGVLPTGIRIVNNESGVMRFEGGNLFAAGILDNHGLMVMENDPQFNGAPPVGTDGVAFGYSNFQPTSFNNHGTVRVDQGQFFLGGSGVHTGQFELLSADSLFVLAGNQSFFPGSRVIGPGTTRLSRFGSLEGALSLEGNFEVESISSPINASLDIGGNLTLVGAPTDIEFTGLVRAGLITGDLRRSFRFLNAVDIAFEQADNNDLGSAEFFGAALIRGDFSSLQSRSVFHQNANITGSVSNAAFMREAIIGGNANNVEFQLGASIGGDLTGGANALGRVNVEGDVIAASGNWSFRSDSGAAIRAFLDVAGDITITRPFEISGDITARGDFSAIQGRYSNITADTIAFGSSTSSGSGNITIFGEARLETGGDRTLIQRARIGSDFGDSPTGFETVTFVNGFEVIYTPVTQFTRAGFRVDLNADTQSATTFFFLADSILAGTLDVFVLGDAAALSFGDSFTILDGSHPFNPAYPVSTISGEFDRLFLPTLSDGLYFDVVYEPSAVRLVVVPAPGPIAAFAGLGTLALTRRRRRATAALATTLAAVAGSAALAGQTTTRWAAPVNGSFFNSANWESGVAPSATVGAVIDATGLPYTVSWSTFPATVRSVVVDSDDVHFAVLQNRSFVFEVIEGLEVRRGRLTVDARMTGGAIRVHEGAVFDIPNWGVIPSYGGAALAMNVINEGAMNIAGEALVTQGTGEIGPAPLGRSITNAATGVMQFAGGNFLTAATLINHGLIEVVNDPAHEWLGNIHEFDGTAFGYLRSSGLDAPAVVNNHGVIRVHQRDLHIEGQGEHSGRFELLSADSTLQFRGEHTFLPGMTITGPGLTRLFNPLTMSGALQTEGSLELYHTFGGSFTTDLALDVAGDLILTLPDDTTFTQDLRAGRITGDVPSNLTFAGNADVGFGEYYGSAEFMGDAIIRSDLLSTGQGSTFHQSAHITGSVRRAIFHSDAVIEGDASRVTFDRGAQIGGDLTAGAQGVGDITVGGDLMAATGNWLFYTLLGSASPTRLEVAGDVDITTPFTIQGGFVAGGAFNAIGGRFESITADAIRFGSSDPSAAAVTIIETGSTITSRSGRTLIENTLIRIDPDGAAFGAEESVFASGLEIIAPISGGLAVVVNTSTSNATTFIVNADSTLSGTLAVGAFGDTSLLSFGDSFTILEGRTPFDATDSLPTISGEFDRLFLPTLSDGLYFDVVYEPSAVRLVVVPAPGAATILAFNGALGFRRRRASR